MTHHSNKTSVQTGRVSDRIKASLKQAILDGEFKTGDKLPPEACIAKIFKVSKVSAREALKEMEAEGLILKRRGVFGGSFVAEPGSEKMVDVVINSYLFGGITAPDLADFRRILEPELARLAAQRRTREDLERMEEAVEKIEASIRAGEPDQDTAFEFHSLIADACHNPFISALMEALVKVFQHVLAKTPDLETAKEDIEYNKRFLSCIRDRDKDGAKVAMNEHFNTLDAMVQREAKLKRAR